MNIQQFTFTQLWYTTTDLMKLIPISRSTFYKMHRELIEQGNDGSQMGKVVIEGTENTLWCPIKFVSYLKKHKILTQPLQYDYEKSEQEQVKVAIGVFNKQQQEGATT